MNKILYFILIVSSFVFCLSCTKDIDAQDDEKEAIEKVIDSKDSNYFQQIDEIYLHIDTSSDESFSEGDTVKILFTGKTLENSSTFASNDSIVTTYISKDLIKGWQIALQNLKRKSVGTLIIPYNLAFGDKRIGLIEPYSTLYIEFSLYN